MGKHKKKKPEIRFKGFTDDWEQRKLSDITFLSGKKNKDNLPYKSYSITNENGFVPQDEKFENGGTMHEADKRMYYIVSPNSFTYNPARINVGSIGYQNTSDNVIVSSLYEVFKTTDDVDDCFLWHWVKSDNFQQLIAQLQEGGVRLYFYYDKLCMGKIMLPNLDEQQRIGHCLDKLDDLITLHQRKLNNLKKVKKSMLEKMFPQNGEMEPQIRFCGFNSTWEQRKLEDIAKRVQGNDGRMNLPTLTISAAVGWMNQLDRFYGNIAGKEQQNYTLLHRGDLSYNHGNSKLAKYGTVFSLQSYEEALVPRVYHSFRMINGSADFIEYYFATRLMDRELSKLISSGARMDGLLNISYDEFVGMTMKLPSIEEQNKIAGYFRKVNSLITLHQRKLEKLKKIKKAMLEKMFV